MNRSGSVHAVVVGHAMRSSTIDNQSATPLPRRAACSRSGNAGSSRWRASPRPRHQATTPGMSATRIGASGELKSRSVNRVRRDVANAMPAMVVTKVHVRARGGSSRKRDAAIVIVTARKLPDVCGAVRVTA